MPWDWIAGVTGIVCSALAWLEYRRRRPELEPTTVAQSGRDLSWWAKRTHPDLLAVRCLNCGDRGAGVVPNGHVGISWCPECGRRLSAKRDMPWITLRTEGVPQVVRKRATMRWLGFVEHVQEMHVDDLSKERSATAQPPDQPDPGAAPRSET